MKGWAHAGTSRWRAASALAWRITPPKRSDFCYRFSPFFQVPA
jgi:hypothetical protein